MAKYIMIQGTMSGAGKSLLVTALCRIFHQEGLRVAPFKSQNMALNSCITADGLEMGRAQAVQAYAAGKEPDVRMNPILLKPSSDMGSQLIVNGRVHGQYAARDYFRMKRELIPDILNAYESLAAENDVIVIEGAGSPAEINLRQDDIVNMGLAELVNAPVLLAGDIDRGGVFAQLYGTIALLSEREKKRVIGTIINKFRGDVELLRPGLSQLEELTGVPVLGVVPYMPVDIDEEDSLSERLSVKEHEKPVDIAVIRFPHISNYTDFTPLEHHPALGIRYVQNADDLLNHRMPDLIILPGTKNTMDDLRWMKGNGLFEAVKRLHRADVPVFGICGGFQMLGISLEDPLGIESGNTDRQSDVTLEPNTARQQAAATLGPNAARQQAAATLEPKTARQQAAATLGPNAARQQTAATLGPNAARQQAAATLGPNAARQQAAATFEPNAVRQQTAATTEASVSGLGLLPCTTVFTPVKTRTRIQAAIQAAPFASISVDGYEIHMGNTKTEHAEPFALLEDGRADGAVCGNVFGTYLHGLFDNGKLTNALAGWLLKEKNIGVGRILKGNTIGTVSRSFVTETHRQFLDRQFDLLAEEVRKTLDLKAILSEMDRFAL